MAFATIDTWPRHFTAGLITGYQRYLSPYKGFSCAHRVLHKGESCSQYVKRVILERGLSDAWPLIQTRFQDCRTAHQILQSRQTHQPSHASIADNPLHSTGRSGRDRSRQCQNNTCGAIDGGCQGLEGLGDCADCALELPNLDCDACNCGVLDGNGCDGGCDIASCDVGGCDVGSCG